MNIRGRDRYENLSYQGGPKPGPVVRFGDYAVPSAVAWVLEPIGGSPAVRAEFEMRDGKPVCTSVAVTATPKGKPVTTADLATLPGLDRKAVDAFKKLATKIFDDDAWREGRNLHRTREIREPDQRAVGAALKNRSDEELHEVARIYRENVDTRPVEAVWEAMGYDSRSTTDRRIKAARDRKFLPPTTKGKRKA